MGGMLGLLSAALSGIGSALGAMGGLGDLGVSLGKAFGDLLNIDNPNYTKGNYWKSGESNGAKKGTYEYNYKNRWQGYWDRQKGNSQ